MKISTFNPQIVTRDAESIVKVFEALGFERRHKQEGIGNDDLFRRIWNKPGRA